MPTDDCNFPSLSHLSRQGLGHPGPEASAPLLRRLLCGLLGRLRRSADVSPAVGGSNYVLNCRKCGNRYTHDTANRSTTSIMFRWIKGLGAGGISAICIGYGFELRPPSKWPVHSALLMMAASISMSISPLIGAAFTQAGKWRWCFLMKYVVTPFHMVRGCPRLMTAGPLPAFQSVPPPCFS